MNPTINMPAKSSNALPRLPTADTIIPGKKTAIVVTTLPMLKQMPV
jgi:hypothetical protein